MKIISFKGFTPAQKEKYFRPKDSAQEKELIEETVEKFDKFTKLPNTLKMLDGDTLDLKRITPKGYKGVNWALTLIDKSGKSAESFEMVGFAINKETINGLINDVMLYVGINKYKIQGLNAPRKINNMFKIFYK